MKLSEIIHQPEGRRLEFKETLPSKSDFAKTIIAFANDAGGELYVGIKNDPREATGLNDDDILKIEEQISNIIFDQCAPIIMPDIVSLNLAGKTVLRIKIYKGNNPPYHLKNKGTREGTYIRVGSSNRLADDAMLMDLERQKRNISFDTETCFSKEATQLNIATFREFYLEKTGERLTASVVKKLNLVHTGQDKQYPTNALVLFSDDELRGQLFPYAKVECARFKGTTPGRFIDQKTIDTHIAGQAEQAYNFVLRHISQSSTFEGVYRIDRWEYPVLAIREAIRNAIVHRDYSLTGKDVKIAVYDDMVEITNPGKLLPSIDFNDLEAGQSDIRNKVIAPVFKRLGIIEQWGTGLKLIQSELVNYPEIELRWSEPGIAFQVQFVKKYYVPEPESGQEHELQHESQYGLQYGLQYESLFSKVLKSLEENPHSIKEISAALGQKTISGTLKSLLPKIVEDNLIERTIPDVLYSPKQQYRLTPKGKQFLELLEQAKKKK